MDATCLSSTGCEVSCPSRVTHTRIVAPVLVSTGTGSWSVTTAPSGAVQRACTSEAASHDSAAGPAGAGRKTAAEIETRFACF